MSNLRSDDKLRNIQPTDVVLGADENGCLFNIPPDNFSGSIPISIDTETGAGEELFTEPELNSFLFKKIKSEDNSAVVTTDTDGNIDVSVNFPPFPDVPTVDYPVTESEDVGDGVSLRRDVAGKKIGIRTLKSDGFVISEEADGSVKINPVGGGSVSNDYYLDVNFTRPSNWTEKAEEIDGIKTAQGTLNDPFKSFEEYLRRCVGETGGSNGYGLYSRVNPKNPGRRLQLLSDLTTDKILEVNQSPLILNKSSVIYTGIETYAASTERLWNAMPKTGGVLDRDIYYEIGGEGSITNKFHFGCVKHKTSIASTTESIRCIFDFSFTGLGILFFESAESATYAGLTKGDGTPYTHGGVQVQGSLQAPTTPLILFDGKNKITWGGQFTGSAFTIQTNTQTAIECINGGSFSINVDIFKYLVNSFHIGYQKKLYTGLGGITADETELLINRNGLFFKPHSDRKIISVKGGSIGRVERITTLSDQRSEIAVDSIFHAQDGSSLSVLDKFVDTGGGCAISLISALGINNDISLSNIVQYCYMNYFITGSGTNDISLLFTNSQANGINLLKKNIGVVSVLTNGSWSSIKGIPINSGIASFIDNAAVVAAGYIQGMAYYNTTESAISIVI